ncbi:hypothetical protein EYR40_010992 [Pleurotus pulmonarius]|nr:hypothetical protein EYR36_002761 [Pleurotus pulmonarius]KAF4586974.1 hypothetical protein EYR40_010992 [Pleurotus pulmonarius]
MQSRKRKSTQDEDLVKFSNDDAGAQDPSHSPATKKRRGHRVTGSLQSLPDSVKVELEKRALGKCCTLTLDPILTQGTIKIAHVVPRATTADRLHSLQEAWHTKELPDVDSPMNLLYLRVDWHRAFDGDLWAMLPSEDILINISSAMGKIRIAKRFMKEVDLISEFSKIYPVKYYKYQLLWLGGSDSTLYSPLFRRRDTTTSRLATAGDEVTQLLELALRYRVFHPPYKDFPTFESHIHPFFAIVNAGSKLSGVPNISQFGPLAEAVLDIYQQWFGLPPSVEPPRATAGEDDVDDGRNSHTSRMDESHSSVASGAQKTGPRKPGRLAQKSGRAPNAQNRAGNEHAAPCDAVDIPSCSYSAGTPLLDPDSSVNALSSHSLNEAEELEDVDTYVSTWLARVDAASPQENAGDRKLEEYDQEPSQQAEPHKWQQWALAPPKMPGLLRDYHDTSKLTSYHWSLYHECVNLMAPTGSHRLPLNVQTPYDPDDVHKYDVWRDDK